MPDTVQTPEVVEAKPTVKPEEAVALIVNGGVPSGRFGMASKPIAWSAGPDAIVY